VIALTPWLRRNRGPLIAALYVVAGFAVVLVLVVATGATSRPRSAAGSPARSATATT